MAAVVDEKAVITSAGKKSYGSWLRIEKRWVRFAVRNTRSTWLGARRTIAALIGPQIPAVIKFNWIFGVPAGGQDPRYPPLIREPQIKATSHLSAPIVRFQPANLVLESSCRTSTSSGGVSLDP